MENEKEMKKIYASNTMAIFGKILKNMQKPAWMVLVLVILGTTMAFGQVSVQVLNSTNVPTVVQNNTIGYNVPVGANRMLLVMISNTERTVNSITFNGTAMTLVVNNTADNRARTHIYRLLNPAQGTGSLVVNFSGAEDRGANIGIVTLGNVDQADPTPYSSATNSTTTAISHSVTSVSGQLVLQVLATNKIVLNDPGTGQTQLWKLSNGSEPTYHGASYKTATSTSTTMTWAQVGTTYRWSMSLVSVKPACITASVSTTQLTCVGGNNGSITVSSPNGGTGIYEYRLDAGTWQSSNTFTGLAAGTYSVQIRDANNTTCTVILGNYTLSTASVAVDAVSSGTFTATPVSLSHTTGNGTNRLMLVGVSTRQRTISSLVANEETNNVTYAGDPLIFVGGNTTDDGITYIFMMIDPPSGNGLLSIQNFDGALSGTNAVVVGITTYSNVNLNSPIGSFYTNRASSATPSLSIEGTLANQLVFDVLSNNNSGLTVTDNSSQTRHWFSNGSQPTAAGYTKPASTGSTSISLTLSASNKWSLSGVAINPALVADLAVTKTVNYPVPYAGEEIIFTMTASNLGCDNAPNVVVEDLLPSGFTYKSHSAPAGSTYVPGGGLWQIDNLAASTTLQLTINAIVNTSGVYTNTASVSGGVVDNNASNNSASVTLTLCQAGGNRPLFNQ